MSEAVERGMPIGAGSAWEHANVEERSKLKAQVARDLSEASGVTEQEAADFVSQWAHSSNDDDMRSLAIQQDAAKEFGLKTSEFTQSKIDNAKRNTEYDIMDAEEAWTVAGEDMLKRSYPGKTRTQAIAAAKEEAKNLPKNNPLMESNKQRAILRTMYNETQAELKSRGITEVRLSRGVSFPKEQAAYWEEQKGQSVVIGTNALESWSVSRLVAGMFAGSGAKGQATGDVGVVLETVVPAERILSTPATGFGCLTEGEVIVLGGIGGDTAHVSEYY
jgi:hypothetical protein